MKPVTDKELIKRLNKLEDRVLDLEERLSNAERVTDPQQRLGGDQGFRERPTLQELNKQEQS